jgi:hypothetical protein
MRLRSFRIVSFSSVLALAACTGAIERTVGPGENDGTSNGDGDGDGEGPLGEAPAGIGTGIFALCEDSSKEQPGPRLLRLMTRREYRNTVHDLLYVEAPDTSSLPVESRVQGFDDNAAAAAVTSRHIDEYLKLGEQLAAEAVQNQKSQLLPCNQGDAGCARSFVERFGLRAFRRPLGDDELDRYSALFDSPAAGGNFDEGMRLVITAMLVSPTFLYRAEVGEPDGEGRFRLTQYEIASALSYLYWASMPDATLFESAAQGALDTPEKLEAEAQRLLDDPRARTQLGEFSLQWLRSDNVVNATKDPTVYPSFNDAVREAMIEEQHRFVSQVVLDEGGSFAELFVADYVLANAELASFYGLSGGGSDFGSIGVDAASGRGGLLGMGAVLAAHAHSMESSPIKRGLFVRDRLLCQNMPPPPADLDTTPPGLDPTLTTRERFAKHTSDAGCASCHQFIDGVGFGFEGFDGAGGRRTVENGLPVDESGNVRGLEGLDKATNDEFEGPRALAGLLAESPSAQACLALQYYRFARGYEERKSDACSLKALQERFEAADLTVKELLVALPTLSSFVLRRE